MPGNTIFRPPFTRRGQNWLPPTRPLNRGSATGSGGVLAGGSVVPSFFHAGQVPSDIVVEWDLDNDGDFSESVEDITSYVLSLETFAGRDWPSMLTGTAGPGKLRATLANDDDRFSYFNSGSPLSSPPFSLMTGRKIRVRTSSASNPDPDALARDRFRRADGPLGSSELNSLAWSGPLADDFSIVGERAVATNDGNEHIALLDVTPGTDYYVQVKLSVIGSGMNAVGVVYRYQDTSNYSLLTIQAASRSLVLSDVVAGVVTESVSQGIDLYDGTTVGVLVSGATATAYLEGVLIFSGSAIQSDETEVGIYASWAALDVRPEIDNFYVWEGLPAQVEGIIWTGTISDLSQTVEAGPRKLAALQGEGRLAALATQQTTPPASVSGRSTGTLVGNVLADALQIHPPGSIDLGDVTTGTFILPASSALEVARQVEETEFGFLYESNEGMIGFDSRSSRDSSVSAVTFSDGVAQFGYSEVSPYDWKKEVFNRTTAGVSPWSVGAEAVLYTDEGPYVLTSGQSVSLMASYSSGSAIWTGHTRNVNVSGTPSGVTVTTDSETNTTFTVSLPAVVNAGDLLMVFFDGYSWDQSPPSDWTTIYTDGGSGYGSAMIAKVADGTEDGTTIVLTGASSGPWIGVVYRVTGWFGGLSGIECTARTGGFGATPNPPAMTPTWGAIPTLFIAEMYQTPNTNTPGVGSFTSQPSGYTAGGNVVLGGAGARSIGAAAHKITTTSTEDPGVFTVSPGWSWYTRTVAVRGPLTPTVVSSDSPSGPDGSFTIAYDNAVGGTVQTHDTIAVSGTPFIEGGQTTVQADDRDSQDDHNAIRTYNNAANLFASTADAQTYADLVLSKFADDRPILSISFYASRSPAYRAQAFRRRVSDKITLIADGNAGLGISADFFIESINHRWSQGSRLWQTTWELSPA